MQVLDLAFNQLSDRHALQLVQIIKDQAEQQDTIKWKKSLRKNREEGRHSSLSGKKSSQ